MGVKIYYYTVAAVLFFGILMPQDGPKRKYYVFLMFLLHTFICGFRYKHLTGDLLKYADAFARVVTERWSLYEVWANGRNSLFLLFRNLTAYYSDGNFQLFLFLIALISELGVAVLIYRYSSLPWLSYYVWNCLSFYIFGFSAIKQALAMGVLMWAVLAILERKPFRFLIFATIAGFIHAPAFVFLPAYWIANRKVNYSSIFLAVLLSIVVFIFRARLIARIAPLYYDDNPFRSGNASLGTRFFFMLVLLGLGILLRGFQDRRFEVLFHLMIVSAILQMFSGYDNVFSRLADYYFQFSILYIPALFNDPAPKTELDLQNRGPIISLPPSMQKLGVFVTVLLLMLYYYVTQLSVAISYSVDNYLNFRFMWEVP